MRKNTTAKRLGNAGKGRSLASRSGRDNLRQVIPRSLNDGPAYLGQKKFIVNLPGVPTILSTTITTGVVQGLFACGNVIANNVQGFSTRFGSTFDEYRILKVNYQLTPLAQSTGLAVCFFDEKLNANPTANESQERSAVRMPLSNTRAPMHMTWKAKDLLDLQYTAIGVDVAPAFFKVYSSNALWGSSVAATQVLLVEPSFQIEFRGLKST